MYLYTSLHPLMWVIFWSNCVEVVTFFILHIYVQTDAIALIVVSHTCRTLELGLTLLLFFPFSLLHALLGLPSLCLCKSFSWTLYALCNPNSYFVDPRYCNAKMNILGRKVNMYSSKLLLGPQTESKVDPFKRFLSFVY